MTAPSENRMRLRSLGRGVELAEARFADHRFSPHRHDAYAVGETFAGVQSFRYRAQARRARPGDAFVLHPDELHDGGPGTDRGYGYRIAYIDPALIARAGGLDRLPFVPAPVTRSPILRRAVAGLLSLAADEPGGRGEAGATGAGATGAGDPRTQPDDLARAEALADLADALLDLSDAPPSSRAPCPARSPAAADIALMHRVREHLADSAPRRPSAAALERAHGLDRHSLARGFKRHFGVSPRRFITLRRLDIAAAEIRRGADLATAALAAGFADQAHMSRAFRAGFGLSPGRWRRLLA